MASRQFDDIFAASRRKQVGGAGIHSGIFFAGRVIHPEDVTARIRLAVSGMRRRSGKLFLKELESLHADGSVHWCMLRAGASPLTMTNRQGSFGS